MHNVVDRGVLRATWEELAGKVVHTPRSTHYLLTTPISERCMLSRDLFAVANLLLVYNSTPLWDNDRVLLQMALHVQLPACRAGELVRVARRRRRRQNRIRAR